MKLFDYMLLALIVLMLLLSVSCTKEEDRCIDHSIEQEKGEEVCVDGICTIQFYTTITCSFNEEDIDKFYD